MMTRGQKIIKTIEDSSNTSRWLKRTCIQQVNDDCLRNIFEFLPIKDRCKIERVCKRWQAVSKDSWQNVKKLNIDSAWGLNVDWLSTPKKSKMLEQVLQRCGRFLVEIDITHFFLDSDDPILSCIAELCPNLQSLNTGLGTLSTSVAFSIALNCHNLISIAAYKCECNDASLSSIFRRNQNLKHFVLLTNGYEIEGKCLLDLPISIETISVSGYLEISSQYICPALKRCKMIRSLSVNSYWLHEVDTDTIMTLPNTLTKLTINNYNDHADQFIMMQLNLKSLSMPATDVTDEFFVALTKNCKNITELNLYSCKKISDIGIKLVTQQLNITVLGVAHTNITNDALKYTQNLRKLDCSECKGVNDAGILPLIKSSNTIEEIILYGTSVTNRLISGATKILSSRPNQILKMDVRYTNVLEYKLKYSMPHNLSVRFDNPPEMSSSSESDDYDS